MLFSVSHWGANTTATAECGQLANRQDNGDDVDVPDTVWGGRLSKRLCNMYSESSTGSWAELQLPCSPSKQGELGENRLQNLQNKWPPRPVEKDSFSDSECLISKAEKIFIHDS